MVCCHYASICVALQAIYVEAGSMLCDASGLCDASDTEGGDSSVVTRWTVDQEVVGSNPTHGGNLISVVRSLSGFTQPIR